MKKLEGKTVKAEKGISKVTWIVIVSIVIIAIFIIVGIVLFVNSPKYAVIQEINSLKNGSIAESSKHINYKSLIKCIDENMEIQDTMSELEKNCFKDISFNINSESISADGATATVNLTVTNKNFRNALNNWIKNVYKEQANGTKITEQQLKEGLNTYLADETIGTITTTKTINLKKENDTWAIEINNDLEDLLFPGLRELIGSIDLLVE